MKPGQVEILELLKKGSDAKGKEQSYAVNVTDADKFQRIHTKLSGEKMVEDYGSVEDYFNHLAKNYNRVAVELLRKNGSTYRPHTNDGPVIFNFKEKPTQAQPQPSQEATPPSYPPAPTHNPGNMFPGLMGGFAGLSGIDTAYRYVDYPKVEAERNELKAKVESLKDEIARLKEEALEVKFSETKASGNKEVITTLMGSLPDILAAFAAKSAAPGLASPAPAEDISEIKQVLISGIKEQSDTVSQYMWTTLIGITSNTEF